MGEQTMKLSANMKQAIEVNDLLKQRCNQYESKFGEMAKTVKESSKCIDEYKKMNVELMKQNKSLHGRLNEIVSKYRQLNGHNDQLDVKAAKAVKKSETLSELCRKLQMKNKDLSDDLKNAKSSLFNAGIVLEFKSDVKEKVVNANPSADGDANAEITIETETESKLEIDEDEQNEDGPEEEEAEQTNKEESSSQKENASTDSFALITAEKEENEQNMTSN